MRASGSNVGALFLDRDGVINYERKGYVKSNREFVFIRGALEGIRRLSRLGLPLLVVTNQSAVGRGLMTRRTLGRIHSRMLSRVKAAGGRIDAIYYCPHTPEEDCDCRKPGILLFKKAAEEFGVDLSQSWFIGDKVSDQQAAAAARCKMLLVKSNTPDELLVASKRLALALGRRKKVSRAPKGGGIRKS